MKNKTVISEILDNYENFTSVERVIADYFINNKEKGDFSINAIKDKLYVSVSSLSRFAQKCGFRGYREFIYKYEENFIEEFGEISDRSKIVLNTYHELLNRAAILIDEKQVQRFNSLINNSNHVLVIGIGSSGLAANEMKQRFMRLGVLMEAEDQSDVMKMQAVLQTPDSLVIGISLSGLKEEILTSLKLAHDKGVKTVLITSNVTDNYDWVDETMIVPSTKNLDRGNIISPQFPILVMIDLIYGYFINNDRTYKDKLHQDTLDAITGKGEIDYEDDH